MTLINSPLKRLNVSGSPPRSKLFVEWSNLTSIPDYLVETSQDPIKYYRELYCLNVNEQIQSEAIQRLTRDDLLGSLKSNISTLFMTSIELLQIAESDQVIRLNIVRTLEILLHDILDRDYEDFDRDIVAILVADEKNLELSFTDLVASLDSMIRDPDSTPSLRHCSLRLSLLLVSSLDSSPLVSYFLRRDFFSGLIAFIVNPQTKDYALEACLLISLLAGYSMEEGKEEHEGKRRNPYNTRIEDLIDENVMTSIIDLVTATLLSLRDDYISLRDDSPPSVVISTITSLVSSLNLNNLFVLPNPFSWTLPSLPLPIPTLPSISTDSISSVISISASTTTKGKGHDRAYSQEVWTSTTRTPEVSTPGSCHSFVSQVSSIHPLASSPTSPSHRPLLQKKKNTTRLDGNDSQFENLPKEEIAALWLLIQFWKRNKTFASLIFSCSTAEASSTTELSHGLISFSSYLFTHSSTCRRSQMYLRLCLDLLYMIVEDGGEGGKLTVQIENSKIRICRQKRTILPNPVEGEKRSLITSLIDTVVTFSSFNLKKRLDVESYTTSLKLLQRIVQQIKSEGVTVEYDWTIVWKSILDLASFVSRQIRELKLFNGEELVDRLICQIVITLFYCLYWSEHFLPCRFAQAQLYHELLQPRSLEILSALSGLLLGGSTPAPPEGYSPLNPEHSVNENDEEDLIDSDVPRLKGVDPISPLPRFEFPPPIDALQDDTVSPIHSTSEEARGETSEILIAQECISSILSTLSFFRSLIKSKSLSLLEDDEEPTEVGEESLEEYEVLKIIESNLDKVELKENLAIGDLPKRGEGEEMNLREEEWEKEMMQILREDTRRLLERKNSV